MLGTPDGGPPWPAGALPVLARATRFGQVTLRDVTAGSQLLKELGMSRKPAVPCVPVAGNTSLIPGAGRGERRIGLRRLLARPWADRTKHGLADRLFGGAGNDIAVSPGSIGRLPAACDHLSCFRDPGSLKALRNVLATTGTR